MKVFNVPCKDIPKEKLPADFEVFACKGPEITREGFRSPMPTLVVGFYERGYGMIELGVFFNEKTANAFGCAYPSIQVVPEPEYQ